VNVEVLTVQAPTATLSSLEFEPNAPVQSLSGGVLAVNCEFDSFQSALVSLGQGTCDELATDALASEVRGYRHAQD
jgi:hypothetical protein